MKNITYILTALVFALPFTASAASFSLTPSSGSFSAGDVFSSTVYITPAAGESITAARVALVFPTTYLEMTAFTPGSGLMAPVAPAIDNTAGTMTYDVGFAAPGISAQKMLGTATFKAKATGTAQVTFGAGAKLLDPTGTEKKTAATGATFTLAAATPATTPPPAVTTPPASATTPAAGSSASVATPAATQEQTKEQVATSTNETATTTSDSASSTTDQLAAAAAAGANSNLFGVGKTTWYYILILLGILLGWWFFIVGKKRKKEDK